MQQDISGAWVSADGRWRWNGQAWVPNSASPAVPAPLSFGDVISLPTRDPRWLGKCGIQGLIALIPIYGSFELLGWALSYLDNLRAGRPDLPEGGFGYAGRGAPASIVALVFWLVAIVVIYAVFGGAIVGLIAVSPHSSSADSSGSTAAGPFPVIFFTGIFAAQWLFFLLYALSYFLVVPTILRTERHGVAAGLNLWGAVRVVREDWRTAAAAGLLVFMAGFFASLGFYACLVGIVFSYGFAAAMLGATIRWYEERRPAGQT